MAPQRRIDVVLDSVKRLLRIGATANLLNLLQKQHPADLAAVFDSLLDTERQAVFSLLVERNGRLAMEKTDQLGSIAIAQAAARNDCLHGPPVAITPGAIQFTMIPNGPKSCARYRV